MAADTRIFADDPESRVHPIVTNLSEYVREIRSRMILEAQEQARLREQLGPDISDPAAVSLMQRQLMQEGAKYRFFIPYRLAYGEGGAGASIPPYAALIFDVELIQVM